MITSRQNPKIKKVIRLSSRAKYRRADSAYVVEGIRLLEEALNTGAAPDFILFTDGLDQRGQDLLESFKDRGVSCEQVEPSLFQEASTTQTTQGMLGVIPILSPALPPKPELVLILDEIRDPGNLGTLLRTALAAGADLAILTKGSADPYAPKVVRSAMGAHFQLPLKTADWEEITAITSGMRLILADMAGEKELWEADLSGQVGLIIGSEAHGAGGEARQRADQLVRIPMDPRAESLNAAAAGAVLLFEIRRQRSGADQ